MQRKTIEKYVHVMKYMGSKRELLEQIEAAIGSKLDEGDVLLDLFSGTCGVGIYLRDKYAVYSNDIQNYSQVISQGIVETAPIKLSKEKAWSLLEENYKKNFDYVSSKLGPYIDQSRYFQELSSWNQSELSKYLKFIQSLPSPIETEQQNLFKKGKTWLESEYIRHHKETRQFPYIQTTFLFSEMYFSLEQAISIDSLKYAIDCLEKKYSDLSKALEVALIHAYSYTSAGTGHFAQFRDLSTISSVEDVFNYRTRSVVDYFLRKTEEIIEATKLNKNHRNSRSFSKDYRELLDDKEVMRKVRLIYADPPYSFVHYSRFYHAIENLCRYDYPLVEHKGRYRTDRHQSPFCISTLAPKAFADMLEKASRHKIPVLISYSNTGMIGLEDIKDIAKGAGYKTKSLEIAHKHSTMGRSKDKDRDVTEALILCY